MCNSGYVFNKLIISFRHILFDGNGGDDGTRGMRIVFRISATADVRLFERTPEHGIGAALVLREDKVGARLNELVQNDVAVVVGVYRLEGGRGEQRVQPEDLEELPVFALVYQVIFVGVDAVEEERERSQIIHDHQRRLRQECV